MSAWRRYDSHLMPVFHERFEARWGRRPSIFFLAGSKVAEACAIRCGRAREGRSDARGTNCPVSSMA